LILLLLWRIAFSMLKSQRQIANALGTLDDEDTTVALDFRMQASWNVSLP